MIFRFMCSRVCNQRELTADWLGYLSCLLEAPSSPAFCLLLLDASYVWALNDTISLWPLPGWKASFLNWLVRCAWLAAFYRPPQPSSCHKHLAGHVWIPRCHPDILLPHEKAAPGATLHVWASHCVQFTLRLKGDAALTGSKCIDGSRNADEILFEMESAALPKHTGTSLQLWSKYRYRKFICMATAVAHLGSAWWERCMKMNIVCHDFSFSSFLDFH